MSCQVRKRPGVGEKERPVTMKNVVFRAVLVWKDAPTTCLAFFVISLTIWFEKSWIYIKENFVSKYSLPTVSIISPVSKPFRKGWKIEGWKIRMLEILRKFLKKKYIKNNDPWCKNVQDLINVSLPSWAPIQEAPIHGVSQGRHPARVSSSKNFHWESYTQPSNSWMNISVYRFCYENVHISLGRAPL